MYFCVTSESLKKTSTQMQLLLIIYELRKVEIFLGETSTRRNNELPAVGHRLYSAISWTETRLRLRRSPVCCVIAHRARSGVRALWWIQWRKDENETFWGLIKITLWLEIKVNIYGNVELVNFPLIMPIDIYLWRLSCEGLLKHHLLYSLICKIWIIKNYFGQWS